MGWIIKPQELISEIKEGSSFKLEKAWVVMVKYVAPVLVVVILVAFVGSAFGVISF